jgi:GntR family transcriptional repressor for pyruvate dehydrogenase complex
VLDAIERRDPQAAERAMREHLMDLQQRLLLPTSGALADAE